MSEKAVITFNQDEFYSFVKYVKMLKIQRRQIANYSQFTLAFSQNYDTC